MSTPLTDQLCALITREDIGAAAVSSEMMSLARRHRVQLLLADRTASDELTHERRAAAAIEALREAELRRVLAAFDRAGICPVLFKGAAIGLTHYRSPELRVRSDTDLLVPPSRSEESARVLQALGYRRAIETDGDLIASQFHCEFVDRAQLSHALDVHWRISNVLAFADVLSYDEIVHEAVPLPCLGPFALGPSAVHSLVLACVHRVGHHPDSADLLWLHDVHLLVNRLTAEERRQFVALTEQRRVRAVCAYTLGDAHRAFGGAAGELAISVEPPNPTDEPTSAYLAPRRRPIDLLAAELLGLGGWGQRWQLLREHVFPRPEYMFARYGGRGPASLPWLYVRRIVAGAPKWFRR